MLEFNGKNCLPSAMSTLCNKIQQAGGEAWLVGGCVRDLVLGLSPKDWDIEVYRLEQDVLSLVLDKLGRCQQVGKQFGVSKLWFEGLEIDIALPRKEKKTGAGHKGFDVVPDPYIPVEKAALRRDFTINAMMYNPLSGQLLDCYHGLRDLKEGRLRHVSHAFVEDPLRPLRAMQFAARFKLKLDKETCEMCRELLPEAQHLPAARIWQEWFKWGCSDYPSFGLQALRDMGWLSLYPELGALMTCPQDKRWHPEGDVWTHTCQVVDEAARLKGDRELSGEEQVVLMFASLCHDFGKPHVTYTSEKGEVLAPKHALAGMGPGLSFLQSIGAPGYVKSKVTILIQEHGAHFQEGPTRKSVSWLAYRLAPVRLRLWEALTEADACGCSPLPPARPALAWLQEAEEAGVVNEKAVALVTGKLLLRWGMKPSRRMGKLIRQAYEAQLEMLFEDEGSAYEWFKKYHIATGGK